MSLSVCLTVALLAAAPAASEGPPPILQPKTYTSPSGQWSLVVDPSARSGGGPGTYCLSRGGKVLWSGELPYTLWEAAVTDAGTFGGYAYTAGWRDYRCEGEFVVAIRDSTGRVLREQGVPRERSRWLHSPPHPTARGLFVREDPGELVVRVPGGEQAHEVWWRYRLSDGVEMAREVPVERLDDSDTVRGYPLAVRSVPGAPLVLTHWARSGWGPRTSRFALLGEEGPPVWSWTHRHEKGSREAISAMHRGEAVRDVARDGFELHLLPEEVRVVYALRPGPPSTAGWTVEELARVPHPLQEPSPEPEPELIDLEELGSFSLEATRAQAGPIRDVSAFGFSSLGRVRFVRREEGDGGFSVVDLSLDGDVLRESRMDLPEIEDPGRIAWYPLADPRWLVTASPWGTNARATAWIVDPVAATWERLEALDVPAVVDAAALGDGGFVLLCLWRGESMMVDSLSAHDASGKHLWRVRQDYQDPAALFSPKALSVRSDGSIAVVDSSRKQVQIFDGGGRHVSNLDLGERWGSEPRYPSGIVADRSGGVVVHDFTGTPPIVWLDSEGDVRASLSPELPDGTPAPRLGFLMGVSPAGELWASDGELLYRLDDAGRVDRVLGELPQESELHEAAIAAVGPQGHVAVLDSRTTAIHLFDPYGVPRWTSAPPEGPLRIASQLLAVDGKGGATGRSYSWDRGLHRYDPRGELLEVREVATRAIAFPPRGNRHWRTTRDGNVELVDEEGAILRTLTRRPDGTWLAAGRTLDCAPDGRLAVRDDSGVHVYGPEGEPLRTYPLASGHGHVGLGRDWLAAGMRDSTVHLVRLADAAVRRIELPSTAAARFHVDTSPDGTELWAVDLDALVVRRYALPVE